MRTSLRYGAALALLTATTLPAAAQEQGARRTRVTLGAQAAPRFPGADNYNIFPLINLDRSRDPAFPFEAPDESSGFLFRTGDFAIGPVVNFQGSRRGRDTDGALPRVGFTVEVGGGVQYQILPAVRVRGEVRKGLGGHKGWVGVVSADYILRDSDEWLVSLGPRVTLADGRQHRAYFNVAAANARPGLPAYGADGGVQAVGLAAEALRHLGDGPWGIYGYAKYDRLVGDAADSPVTRAFGSRNQLSGGVALSYTFGG